VFGARNDLLHAWLQHAAWEQAVPVTTPAQALAAGLQGRTVGEQRGRAAGVNNWEGTMLHDGVT
jgi:hypothetical protein